MQLLPEFGKYGVKLGLLTKEADINDTEFLSKYFVLQEFSPEFTAGKNSVTFNGSEFLKVGSEILVECLDSAGEALYIEATSKTSTIYKEASTYILSIHVYSEISNGPGKLVFYGILKNGATVKWIGNVLIDKNKSNISTVRFYNKPVLEVRPILTNVVAEIEDLNKQVEFSSSYYSYAVVPQKDTLQINKRNVDVDYRIYAKDISPIADPTGSFNDQLEGFDVEFRIKTIQDPYSYKNSLVNYTSSVNVKKVINNSTMILSDVISYKDNNNNDVVVNVVDGVFFLKYPYIIYNVYNENINYLSQNTAVPPDTLAKKSFADIIYRNLRTFSGFISRHKLYRKSLFSTGDFEVISDEPLTSYEILQDKNTTNKAFNKMGWFYNQYHVDKYWFVSNDNISLIQSSDVVINSVNLKVNVSYINCDSLNNYIILKDYSSGLQRNADYYPYDLEELSDTSGPSYDSNFIELKKDVNYILSFKTIIKKDSTTIGESDARIEFYFTSSLPVVNTEQTAIKTQSGLLKLGEVIAYEPKEETHYDLASFIFTPSNDLYGTLVIVPRKCSAILSEISFKPYSDSGYSPDTLITRIPFPVSIANEAFEIKSELFDINSNLVYSDLRTVASFDPLGSTLQLYIPGFKDPSNTDFISGDLEVSKSLWVGKNVIITGSLFVGGAVLLDNIIESDYTYDRLLSWNYDDKQVYWTNIKGIEADDYFFPSYVNVDLYPKRGNLLRSFRFIPSVPGRNVKVLKPESPPDESILNESAS